MIGASLPTHPRALVVSNPGAGGASRRGHLREAVGALAEAGWDVTWRATRAPGDGRALAREAAEAGCHILVAAGGDGTVNEVVNGLVGSRTALAVLPAGTGNVLAAELGLVGIPTALHRADLVAAAGHLAQGRLRRVDVGVAEPAGAPPRYFLLVAGVGLDAAVTREVEGPARELKRVLGPAAFGALGLKVLWETTGTQTVATMDGEEVSGELLLALLSNTRLYGGTLAVSRDALIDDGQLDVELFFGEGILSSMAHIGAIVAGRPESEPRAGSSPLPPTLGTERPDDGHRWVHARARRVRIDSVTPLPVHVDAEPHGRTPVTFGVVPRALSLVVPPTASPDLFAASSPDSTSPAPRGHVE